MKLNLPIYKVIRDYSTFIWELFIFNIEENLPF
jgi:hypothetical protein